MKRPRMRRLFQFSLRTMLVVVVVLSMWLGMTVRKARQQKAAVEWVEANGGFAVYDYQTVRISHWDPNAARSKPPGPEWLRELIGVDYFATVVAVDFIEVEIADLRPLSRLVELEDLGLYRAQVADLSGVAELTKLNSLRLRTSKVTDVTPLGNSASLTFLDLSDTPVTAEEIAKLQKALPNCKIRQK